MFSSIQYFRLYIIFLLLFACNTNKNENKLNSIIERVLRIEPHDGNTRNSEGDFIWLNDGRLLFVYSYFTASLDDLDSGYLAGRYSLDSGKTWTSEDQLVIANEGKINIMSVSLLRLQNGAIALFYCRKNSNSDCIPMVRISSDEAKSWGEPKRCINLNGNFRLVNDRVIQLQGGRIVMPVALGQTTDEMKRSNLRVTDRIMCYYSDDNGISWEKSQDVANPTSVILQEPGIVELKNGLLMLFCRTNVGTQYISYSEDFGENWSPVQPSNIKSPRSAASIKRIPGTDDLLLVWNENYDYAHSMSGDQTPLDVAISTDEGKTWQNKKTIEDDPDGWFCYPAIEFTNDKIILAYSAGTRKENSKKLATEQITRVDLKWLYSESCGVVNRF